MKRYLLLAVIAAFSQFAFAQKNYMVVEMSDGNVSEFAVDKVKGVTFRVAAKEYEYVDLGLSVKWATCNVGANSPEETGGYYAWGETHEHRNADGTYNDYIHHYYNGSYCFAGDGGYQYVDRNGKTLYIGSDISGNSQYDVATLTMGTNWRMPKYSELKELLSNTTSIWTDNYMGTGVSGRILTSTKIGYTDASIFLPAAGYRSSSKPSYLNKEGRYWTGSICDMSNVSEASENAFILSFDSENSQDPYFYFEERFLGFSIRPVFVGNESSSTNPQNILIDNFWFTETSSTIEVGENKTIDVNITPQTATNKKLEWSSSNSTIATVSENGVVHALSPGSCTISAKTTDGSNLKKTFELTVKSDNSGSSNNGHECVDLGLSVKWATCNVGATSPEGYGDYFAWGETEPKNYYSWSTYKWCNGTYNTQIKYCTSSGYGTVDNKTILELTDDAARVNWGGTWRMPTDAELTELREKCTWTWTTKNGVKGYEVKSKTNGNSIFLPAAGYRDATDLNLAGSRGYYWSSSLSTSGSDYAYELYFNSDNVNRGYGSRVFGQGVRPVCP